MKSERRLSALRDVLTAVNAQGARGALLGLGSTLILLPALLGGHSLTHALRYDRASIAAGEWWRLLSGQFVHLDPGHALANAAGLLLVWALVGAVYRASVWVAVACAVLLGTSAGLWWGSPEVHWYVGASGWLHGLLAAGAWSMAAVRGDRLGRLVVLALAVKLSWEQTIGPIGGHGSVAVIVDAHLYGAVAGVLCALRAARRPPPVVSAPRGRAPL